MFQLFKERNFSDYINDTFAFFRVCGRHFFKLYFIINGSLLLIAVPIVYFLARMYFEFLGAAMNGMGVQENYTENYLSVNQGMLIVLFIAAALIFLLITILQYAFPVVYLDLYDSRKGIGFEVKDVLNGVKKRIWKVLKFIVGLIFIILPIITIVLGLNMLLVFILIGLPLFLLTVPLMISFVSLSYYYYMNSEEGFFSALGDAIDTIRGQFWPIVFSTLVTLIIYYVVSTIITIVPYFVMMASMFTTLQSGDPQESFSGIGIMMAVVMVVSLIVNMIMYNLILINQGMVYYSHIENAESSVSNNSIDLIGTESE